MRLLTYILILIAVHNPAFAGLRDWFKFLRRAPGSSCSCLLSDACTIPLEKLSELPFDDLLNLQKQTQAKLAPASKLVKEKLARLIELESQPDAKVDPKTIDQAEAAYKNARKNARSLRAAYEAMTRLLIRARRKAQPMGLLKRSELIAKVQRLYPDLKNIAEKLNDEDLMLLLEQHGPPLPLSYSVDSLQEAMREVRELRIYFLEAMEDPYVPREIKLILKQTLEGRRVNLSLATADWLNQNEPLRGGHVRIVEVLVHPTTQKDFYIINTESQHEGDVINPDVVNRGNPQVSIEYEGNDLKSIEWSDGGTDLAMLAHELAHARFERFIKKNIEALAKRFPSDLIYKVPSDVPASGVRYAISKELYSYLTERYAYSIQVKAYYALKGAYHQSTELMLEFHGARPGQSLREMAIIKDYNITDPRIIGMENRSLKNILLEGYEPKKHPSVSVHEYRSQFSKRQRKEFFEDNFDLLKRFSNLEG